MIALRVDHEQPLSNGNHPEAGGSIDQPLASALPCCICPMSSAHGRHHRHVSPSNSLSHSSPGLCLAHSTLSHSPLRLPLYISPPTVSRSHSPIPSSPCTSVSPPTLSHSPLASLRLLLVSLPLSYCLPPSPPLSPPLV